MLQHLRIDVRLPEGHWAGDVSRSHPSATLRIDQHMPMSKGRGTARCWTDVAISTTIAEHPGIDKIETFEDGMFSVHIRAGGGGFLRPLVDLGIVPQTPFEVRDGWVEWVIQASSSDIRKLIDSFRADQIPHRILSTRNAKTRLLTPRQKLVFETALKHGYWDVPRKVSLSELAAMLKVAKSTLSGQLQRIEQAVFHSFAEEIRRQSP